MIDGALEEIERTELEMLDLLLDLLGPDGARLVADHIEAQSQAPRLRRLVGRDELESPDRRQDGYVTPDRSVD